MERLSDVTEHRELLNNVNINNGEIYLDYITASNKRTKLIHLTSNNCVFKNCTFYISQDNLFLSFSNCVFLHCRFDMDYFVNNSTSLIYFTNCSFDDITFSGNRYSGVTFFDCDIYKLNLGDKLPVYDSIDFILCSDVKNVTAKNTIITNLAFKSNGIYKDIDLDETAIESFTMIDNHKQGYWAKEINYSANIVNLNYMKKVVRKNGKKKE